ncbi:DUF6355 family natural product biosynthesis protein [Allokutzneria oryzae]|uniref:DUF6355 family natural product biosynthesis protein n=1 Tax=Allokutzneria oryzae TaxID=1378989 RepID=A0ABV6A3N0_9PSEU
MQARSRVALPLAVVAATMGLVAPAASAAPAPAREAAARQCGGYHHDETWAYYTHCGPTPVNIHIDIAWGPDETRCVKRNSTTNIGLWPRARNAWYIGLC